MSQIMESKRLSEERQQLVHHMNTLVQKVKGEEKRSFNNEELEHFDKLDAAQKELQSQIETAKREELVTTLVPTPNVERTEYRPSGKVTARDRSNSFRAWALYNGGASQYITDDMVRSCELTGTKYRDSHLNCTLSSHPEEYLRAQTKGTDNQGGFLENDGIVQFFEKQLAYTGGMREASFVLRTERGDPLQIPKLNDTTSNAAVVAENTTVSNAGLTFTSVSLSAHKYATGVYPVSWELIEDSAVPVEQIIGEALGERIGRFQNADFTTGDDTGNAEGFITHLLANSGAVTADATNAISYGDIVGLMHSVDRAYRTPGAVFMCHDSILSQIKQILDGNNRPLWGAGLNGSEGDRIMGWPVIVNNDMDSTLANNNEVLAFGNFKKGYWIRDVASGMRISVLRERHAQDGAISFIAHMRSDGGVVQTAALRVLQL